MEGWIIDARGEGSYRIGRPGQQPIFYVGEDPVFEVWFWDAWSILWFVMTADPALAAEQGAVGFHPLHTRDQVIQLRDQWRVHRAAGGHEPNRAAGH